MENLPLNIDILRRLYKDVHSASTFAKNSGCMQSYLIPTHQIKQSRLGLDSSFIPIEIKDYIVTKGIGQLVYKCVIHKHEITLFIMCFPGNDNESKFDRWAQRMFAWLHIGFQYSTSTCAQRLSIYIYPTPFKKRLPQSQHECIGPAHVNTGVAWRCAPHGEIIVYREEEWFKVFVHETFHALGLDLDPRQVGSLKDRVRHRFPIESDFNVAETYTEVWARIINTAFYSYETSRSDKKFIKNMVGNLTVERNHSITQMNKILRFMGVPFSSLIGKSEVDILKRRLYKEKSNVFAYYILGAMLMNDPNLFMEWCEEHNIGFINFDISDHTAQRFGDLLERCSNEDGLEMNMQFKDDSARMTYLQIN